MAISGEFPPPLAGPSGMNPQAQEFFPIHVSAEQGSSRKRTLSMEADESRFANGRALGDLAMGPPTHYRRCNFDEDDIEWGHDEEPDGTADTGAPQDEGVEEE